MSFLETQLKALTAKISSLETQLKATKEKIQLLEESSPWSSDKATKYAEIEFEVLRRRLQESEENYHQADRMFHDYMMRWRELKEEVDRLKESLGKVAEAERLAEEKTVENESLRRALRKEKLISTELKATLALEEEKKKEAEIKIVELEVRMSKSISKATVRAMEEFMASSKMDLNIAFDQKAFIKDFELYEGRVAQRFPELDLSFLEEELDEEAGPSGAAANPSPAEVVFESFELVVKVLEPMQVLEVVFEVPVESVLKPMATPGVSSSFAAFPSEVGGL
ncbi:hypothetical protein COCNU_scaffold009135G000010 [Cocos nucifera]|nr:hypothetical protein [Cocos nucifera]